VEKRCTKCKQVKPLTEFDTGGHTGRQSYCKACRREMRRTAYVPHPKPRISVDLGQRFGRLTVLGETAPRNGSRRVFCACDCGNDVTTNLQSLIKGETTSCGCYHRELLAQLSKSAEQRARRTKHGQTHHPLYSTWNGMMARCYDERHAGFKNYGARGITVCEAWHDVRVFVAWVEQNLGARPDGRTMDRIDNDAGYAPGNIRWATYSEQRRNRRSKEKRDADATRLAAVRA